MKAVQKAERLCLEEPHNFEYLPIDGIAGFRDAAAKLLYGKDSEVLKSNRVAIIQSLSGTGALRVAGDFLRITRGPNTAVHIPTPTWENHDNVFKQSGLTVSHYRYYNSQTLWLDFDAMKEDLTKLPDGSVVLLHACAHNPTGIDPTPEQMREIVDLFKAKGHLPILDSAYQGFASGSLDRDAQFIRLFAESGLEMMVAQSFSKNLGLYNERIGTLSVVCQTPEQARAVLSQLKAYCARPNYSNPPSHGARIVAKVLTTPELYEEWETELKSFADRIIQMRQLIYNRLKELETPGTWDRILKQIGMFSYTGLTREQCDALISQHHIYLLRTGRISMAGVTPATASRIAEAIDLVVRTIPSRL